MAKQIPIVFNHTTRTFEELQVGDYIEAGLEGISVIAYEALSAGDAVHIFNDSGTLKARKAIASTSFLPCHGFATTTVVADATVVIQTENVLEAFSGLTIGSDYYLSATTAGVITTTPPNGSGQFVQKLGFAVNSTTLMIKIEQGLRLH